MPARPPTTSAFLDSIRKCGLIDERTLSRFAADLPADPAACTAVLVRANVLTAFQAEQLLAGRSQKLSLGPYRILSPIGKGGMGVVYLAEHTGLGRKVALKMLSDEHAREELALERLFREARAAAALDHPNIVRLHDIAQARGVHFLVMEYVDGTDLQTLLEQSGPFDCSQAANYVAQAAAGLQHAHERGFVHRDIKPANLMLTRDGTLKVLDMGLARSVENPKDALTGQLGDAITGTADYLSPEQALNLAIDARADIYSLGATFCALLTGRPPYDGSTTQKLAQHQMAPPPDLCRLRPGVPPALNAVVSRMMAKSPTDRFQSAREVVAALAPWLPAGLLAAAAVSSPTTMIAGAPTGVVTQVARPDTGQVPARAGRRLAFRGLVAATACVGLLLAGGLLSTILGGSKPATTSATPPADDLPPPPTPDVRVLTGHTQQVNDVTVSPDGSRVASVDWAGKLFIWDARTGQRLFECPTRHRAKCHVCVTTPDGRLVLVAGDRMPILAFEWATGREVREYPGHDGSTWGLAVSPSGEQLLSCGADGAVVLRDLAGGAELRRFTFAAKVVMAAAFSPDGTKIAAGCGTGPTPDKSYLVKVWSADDGKELHRLSGHTWDVRSVAFRPDGKVLASASFDGAVRLWDLTTGTELHTITAHDGIAERVFFLSDGRRLLTCGGPLPGNGPAAEGGAVKIWDADTGREVKGWQGEEWSNLICLMPSPDGKFAVAGSRERIVRVWSLAAPTGERPIFAFDLAAFPAFKLTHQDGQSNDPNWRALAERGVLLHCWKKESVAEFRCEQVDGHTWIGVTNLNNEVSSQILFQFDEGGVPPLTAGTHYRVRLEYKTTNDADGWAAVRNPKGMDYPSISGMSLERTDGKWKVAELKFRRPADGKIDLCLTNNAVGEGNLLGVRSVEVFEVRAEK